jgi:hypothetical protein
VVTQVQDELLILPGWREIPLTKGLVAKVDEGDYAALAVFKWHASVGQWHTYAARRGPRRKTLPRKQIFMHRVILTAPEGVAVDHINGDTLDNRHANLRFATASQNARNSTLSSRNTSGFKGVSFDRTRGKWRASIKDSDRKHTIGRFDSALDAARAYDEAALQLYGEFARTNGVGGQ